MGYAVNSLLTPRPSVTDMGRLSGRTIIVTGAAGNLGAAVARRAHQEGATLIAADREAEGLSHALEGLDRVRAVSGADLLTLADCRDIVDACLDETGRLDGLVQCVGGFSMSADFAASTPEDWTRMLDLNLRTTETLCRAVLPMMARHGALVTVGAGAAADPGRGMGAYAASKAALMTLTRNLATELRPSRIRVNCILPSIIDTPENRKAMPKADPADWITPEAIAETVCFLLSPEARCVTGGMIPVDLPD